MPKHYQTKSFLPASNKSPDTINIQRDYSWVMPVCVGAVGNPGTIASGTPGAISYCSWTASSLLNDRYNMVTNQLDPTYIRIPGDGYYDFYLHWNIADDIHTFTVELQPVMELAITSDAGFGAPSFSTLIIGSTTTKTSAHIDNRFDNLYRGVELHANNLLRFGIKQYGGTNLVNTTVSQSEFRMTYAIPNSPRPG